MDASSQDHVLSAIRYLASKGNVATLPAIRATEYLTTWDQDDATLATTLETLIGQGHVIRSGAAHSLTATGQAMAREVDAAFFGHWMITCEQSRAYRRLCQRVSGLDVCHFGMLTQAQLDLLCRALDLSPDCRVLDLGCGTGALTAAIADRTGATLTGIDFSAEAIRFAAAIGRAENSRVSYRVVDMDSLTLPRMSFDVVLSIDTLYFAEDLSKTLAALKTCLVPGGRMGLFFNTRVAAGESRDRLAPDKTVLAAALERTHLSYDTWDLTAEETRIWEEELQFVQTLKAEFVAEGNLALFEGRVTEATHEVDLGRSDRKRRYLYRVRC